MFSLGWLITLAGLGLVVFSYFAGKPDSWSYVGWFGVFIGALIIYVEWR